MVETESTRPTAAQIRELCLWLVEHRKLNAAKLAGIVGQGWRPTTARELLEQETWPDQAALLVYESLDPTVMELMIYEGWLENEVPVAESAES